MDNRVTSDQGIKDALRGSPAIVWAQDRDLRYIWVFNPSMGLTADEIVGKTDRDLLDAASAYQLEILKRKAMSERAEQSQSIKLVNGGIEEVHEVFVRPVVGEDGQVVGVTGVSMRVYDESRILAIEADHRIKNSLMLAQSLLRTQSRTITDNNARLALRRAAGEIGAIAHLHATFAEGGPDGVVNLKDYLETALRDLAELLKDHGSIEIKTDLPDELFDGGSALKIALIVTELITNSVKHAGNRNKPLVIRVSYSGNEEGRCLVVEDNGEGLPYDFDATGDSGIGLRVIQSMSHALGTSPEIDKKAHGARFIFRFPLS